MPEVRKKLSNVQFRTLVEAQLRYNKALDIVRVSRIDVDRITALVYDALGVTPGTEAHIDQQTQELVYTQE